MRAPPAIATWFLTGLAPSTPDSALGDLQEEYESGRSPGWYWRQVLRAIAASTVRQIHAHPLEMIRAVIVGWAFLWIFFSHVFPLLVSPDEWLFVRGVADIRSWWPTTATTLLREIISPLACVGAGWIVARFHKREMVLIFVVTVLAWNLMGIMYAFKQGWLREGFLIPILASLIVMLVSIVVGGLFGGYRAEAPE
jgi:hypothetical protein